MNKLVAFFAVSGLAVVSGCSSPTAPPAPVQPGSAAWLDRGVCYEIFVRSFYDSDGDGIGDLEGLIQKLDYVNDGDPATTDDLGATCIWLMPVAESPSYHGYDVTDYYAVEPDYGTNDDFRRFTDEAHRRGIKVLVDMVINHSSDEHPFFQEALNDPASPYRSWYRFSPAPGPNNEWGDNNWRKSPVRDEYYYGFFSHRMPDLNWGHPSVRDEMNRVASYWLGDMGADGLRLDAVWHLMEGEDGQAGHAPRTHEMLHEYGEYVRSEHPDSYTLGEVFDGSDAIFAYYPDQLDAYFAFGVSGAILEAVQTGGGSGLLDAALRMQGQVPNHRYAPFLRNHDQTRTLTVLGGDVARAKLAATLLLTLPGVPFIYYGEELGMQGDKPDPRLRTPMPWSAAPAGGFTTGAPWEPMQEGWETANVEALGGDEASILNLYRKLIRLRQEYSVLGAKAELVPVQASHPSVVAYLRQKPDSAALVVANLSEEALSDVTLSVAASFLPPGGELFATLLLRGGQARMLLDTDQNGGFTDYEPIEVLEPLGAYVIGLSAPD